MFKCQFCGKEFEKATSLGGHSPGCKENPNYKNNLEKKKYTLYRKNVLPYYDHPEECRICGDYIEYSRRGMAFCGSKKCLSEINSHEFTDETKKKISDIVAGKTSNISRQYIGKYTEIKYLVCPICQTLKIKKYNDKSQTCGKRECISKNIGNQVKGKTGGYVVKSGTSKFHGSYYKDIWMDSSWERKLAERLDFLNIEWERDTKRFFQYTDIENKSRKYYPDFYLPLYDLFLECKGYWTEKVVHKMNEVRKNHKLNILILESLKEIENFELK